MVRSYKEVMRIRFVMYLLVCLLRDDSVFFEISGLEKIVERIGWMGGENLKVGNIVFFFKKFIWINEMEGGGVELLLSCVGDLG